MAKDILFCVCLSVKTGCLILGCSVWSIAVFSLSFLLWDLIFNAAQSPIFAYNLWQGIAVLSCLGLVASTMLLIGIYKKKAIFLLPFMGFILIVAAVGLGALIAWLLIELDNPELEQRRRRSGRGNRKGVFGMIVIMFYLLLRFSMHSFKVVKSHYRHLKGRREDEETDLDLGTVRRDNDVIPFRGVINVSSVADGQESTHQRELASLPPSYEEVTGVKPTVPVKDQESVDQENLPPPSYEKATGGNPIV